MGVVGSYRVEDDPRHRDEVSAADRDRFDAFWREYAVEPMHSEVTAQRAFFRLSAADQALAVRFAGTYCRECRMKNRKMKDPAAWLRERVFVGYAKAAGVDKLGDAAAVGPGAFWIVRGSPQWFAWCRYLGKPSDGSGRPFSSWSAQYRSEGRIERSEWPPNTEPEAGAPPARAVRETQAALAL